MIEKNEPFDSSSEEEPNSANIEQTPPPTFICRIVPGEEDPETGEVFAEVLYYSDPTASDAEEDIIMAQVGYDPQEFPEDIRDEILAGKPFEITSTEVQSPDDEHAREFIEVFSLVKE